MEFLVCLVLGIFINHGFSTQAVQMRFSERIVYFYDYTFCALIGEINKIKDSWIEAIS